MKTPLYSVVIVVVTALVTGCGPLHVNRTVGLSGLPTVEGSRVTVVENWADATKSYQVVGKGSIYRNAGGVPKGGAIKRLRQMAGEMGANGVIGLHGTTSFRTGLMVKWLEPGETSRPVTVPFVVGVLPVIYDTNAPGNNVKISGILRESLWPVESKGYYLLPGVIEGFSGGIDGAGGLDDSTLADLGGSNAQLLLEVRLAGRSEWNAGILAESSANIQARLLNKATRKIVYEGFGKGGGGGLFRASGGLLASMVAPDDKRIEAVVYGAWEALENLKPIAP